MSFKREGTDRALLQDLQKRRVSEILVTHIPEDEALLLKNGKYSCTLCPNRPVLDTIEMLAMHRKGKRHLIRHTTGYSTRGPLVRLGTRRGSYVFRMASHIKCLSDKCVLIGLSKHLSQMKWKEQELQKRLQEAYVTSGARQSSTDHTKPLGPASAKATKKAPRLKLMKSAPYNSCCKKKLSHQGAATEAKGGDNRVAVPSTSQNPENPLVKAYIKKVQQKNSFSTAVEQSKRNSTLTSSTRPLPDDSGQSAAAQSMPKRKRPATKEIMGDLTEEEAKEKAKAQYFLNLRMSGWKLDRDGKWVKDENAEFDSDEEEPPAFNECVVSTS